MNAAEQATGLEVASKIATVVNLFKSHFPDARADLNPWRNDPDTRELVDPDSIDIGFHLPGWSPRFQSRSILVQIRVHTDPLAATRRAIGVEAVGMAHTGEQWRLSTIGHWHIVGDRPPAPSIQDRLKQFCRQTVEVFNQAS